MKSIELFAGAGGLALGLSEAGFDPVLIVERDPLCQRALEANQRRILSGENAAASFAGDARDVDFTRYRDKVALISGGPPCQPFSLGGLHRAELDARDMFPQAIRAVAEARPRAFVFENVRGLVREAFRDYFDYIRARLSFPEDGPRPGEAWPEHLARLRLRRALGQRADYEIVTTLVDAADYGVPQRRHRVFLVGLRRDLVCEWRFPASTHSREALRWDIERGDYWRRRGIAKRHRAPSAGLSEEAPRPVARAWRTVRDAIDDLPDPERRARSAANILNHRFQPGARAYPGHTGSPLDAPAKTLKAGVHGVPGGENMLREPDGRVRYFTIRECARLQTFPDDYAFEGSWSDAMRQLGNAVPPKLARVIGESLAAAIGQSKTEEKRRPARLEN